MPSLIAALLVLPLAGPVNPATFAKRVIDEDAMATLSKDLPWFEKHLPKDFVYIDSRGGRASRARALDALQGSFENFKRYLVLDNKLISARRVKQGVLIRLNIRTQAIVVTGEEKEGYFVSRARVEALATPVGTGWVYRHIKILDEVVLIDGKRVER